MHLFSEDIHGWRRWELSLYNFKICAFECQFARCTGLIVCFNETAYLLFIHMTISGFLYTKIKKKRNVRDVPNGGGIF